MLHIINLLCRLIIRPWSFLAIGSVELFVAFLSTMSRFATPHFFNLTVSPADDILLTLGLPTCITINWIYLVSSR